MPGTGHAEQALRLRCAASPKHDMALFRPDATQTYQQTRPVLADRDSLLRRLHELRSEHRDLDTVIARLELSLVDQLQLQRLKKRKLKLKDEIAWLESRLVPDIIA